MFQNVSIRWGIPTILVLTLAGCAGAGPPTPSASASGSDSLPPDGSWQVELTADDLIAAGWPADVTAPGTYTWTFASSRARIDLAEDTGNSFYCEADMEPLDGGFRLRYDDGLCGGEVDDIGWDLDDDGLHLVLIATDAPVDQQKAYLETKPWQAVEGQASLDTPPPWQSRCEPGCQGPIATGTFTSAGFIPGLQLTFADDSWFNTADYPDEIEFDTSDSALRFWQNPGAASETGDLLDDYPGRLTG